jgi:hypothetical protein
MKTPTIIITRDKDDMSMVSVFAGNGNPLMKSDGCYEDAVGIDCESFDPDWFKKLFRFLPRRGTKTVYELKEGKHET